MLIIKINEWDFVAAVAKAADARKTQQTSSTQPLHRLRKCLLQATIDPIFRNVILGENNEIKAFSEEQLYSYLLGALTSVGMNAATGEYRNIVLPDGKTVQVQVDKNGNPVETSHNVAQPTSGESNVISPIAAENAPANGTEAGKQSLSWQQRLTKENGVSTLISSDGERNYIIPSQQEVPYSISDTDAVRLNKSVAETINPKDYRDFAKAYADKNLITKFDNNNIIIEAKPITISSDGNEVIITNTGIKDFAKKIRGQGMKSKDNLDSVLLLDKIIQNSHKINDSPNTKGRVNPFSYYESNFSVGNRNYRVNLRIKNTPKNNQYYYHSLENIEIAPSNETSYHNSGGPDLIVNGATSTPHYTQFFSK